MLKEIELKNFYFSYYTDNRPEDSCFFKNLHLEFELYLLIEGDAQFIVEDRIYLLNPYDLIVIKPGEYHLLKPGPSKNFAGFLLNLHESRLPKPLNTILAEQKKSFFNLKGANHTVPNLFFKMLSYREKYGDDILCLLADAFLTELILAIESETFSDDRVSNVAPVIKQILEYIDKNIETELTLKALSEYFFISQSQISHKFVEAMNISPAKYIRNKKIYHARNLIAQGLPLSQVYNRCGFGDYSSFYKAFKTILNVKPSDIRPNR